MNCAKLRALQWDKNNVERKRKRNAEWHTKNRQKVIFRVAKYKKENPEKCRVFCSNYRAKKKYNGGKLSVGIVKKLSSLQQGRCACCKSKLIKYDVDHIVPISKGGMNIDSNVQLLCQKCNRKKGAIDSIDFMQKNGYLL